MNFESNPSFHPTIPKLQIAFDSTSLGALKTCPRYYYYSIVLGVAPRGANIHLEFGLLYHAALERYDHARFAGASHDDATLRAVDYCMKETWDAQAGRPKAVFCEDSNKNRLTLVRTVVWYLEEFRDDTLRTAKLSNGKPAVELSFRFQTTHSASDGTPFAYCGHLDRVACSESGENFILDRKTTKHTIDQHYFAQYSPNNQFTGYFMGGKILMPKAPSKILVDAAQIAVNFSRFARGIIEISDMRLDEWNKGLGNYFSMAEAFARQDFWPLNESSCGNYGGCPYRDVCSKKTNASREEWLRAKFAPRRWNPLQSRGDV